MKSLTFTYQHSLMNIHSQITPFGNKKAEIGSVFLRLTCIYEKKAVSLPPVMEYPEL